MWFQVVTFQGMLLITFAAFWFSLDLFLYLIYPNFRAEESSVCVGMSVVCICVHVEARMFKYMHVHMHMKTRVDIRCLPYNSHLIF